MPSYPFLHWLGPSFFFYFCSVVFSCFHTTFFFSVPCSLFNFSIVQPWPLALALLSFFLSFFSLMVWLGLFTGAQSITERVWEMEESVGEWERVRESERVREAEYVHFDNYPRLSSLSCPLLQISLRFITWPDQWTTNQPLRCALGWVCPHGPFARPGLSCLLFLIAPLRLTSAARWVCVPGCVGVRLHGMSARKHGLGANQKTAPINQISPISLALALLLCSSANEDEALTTMCRLEWKGPPTTLHVFSFLELPCFSRFNRFNPWKNKVLCLGLFLIIRNNAYSRSLCHIASCLPMHAIYLQNKWRMTDGQADTERRMWDCCLFEYCMFLVSRTKKAMLPVLGSSVGKRKHPGNGGKQSPTSTSPPFHRLWPHFYMLKYSWIFLARTGLSLFNWVQQTLSWSRTKKKRWVQFVICGPFAKRRPWTKQQSVYVYFSSRTIHPSMKAIISISHFLT